jgi:hypothetical protein
MIYSIILKVFNSSETQKINIRSYIDLYIIDMPSGGNTMRVSLPIKVYFEEAVKG